MSNDTELFELCKEVYEKTEWRFRESSKSFYLFGGEEELTETLKVSDIDLLMKQIAFIAPLYTTDYLLEILPKNIEEFGGDTFYLSLGYTPDGKTSVASYSNYDVDKVYQLKTNADTPLKALLKLTLALHEVGIELKEPSDV